MPCRVKSYLASKHERIEFLVLVSGCRNLSQPIAMNGINSKICLPIPKFRISENFFGLDRPHNLYYFRT